MAQPRGDRPQQANGVRVLHPQARTPVSLLIDDSTCLVNLAHFAMPQFGQVRPQSTEYQKPWQQTPREIPDSFVRKFGLWCREQGIKGKYSVIPYPACVGWLDRVLPDWTHRQLADSLGLVRELMTPDWDITPEMISHTRVIDIKTGRPYAEPSERFMENWHWSDNRSVDELAEYMSYALQILKNVDLPCQGVTSPGTFGSGSRAAFAPAVLQACRHVFQTEIPYYFLDVFERGGQSVAPLVQCAADLEGASPRCVVSIIACTADWFGGWDGMTRGSPDFLITKDLHRGRLVEVIGRGDPAVLCCHWPGLYFGGAETGLKIFQEVVARLHARYENLIWMKVSEIARYWAARQLTGIDRSGDVVRLAAPFAAANFTLSVPAHDGAVPRLLLGDRPQPLREVSRLLDLRAGTFLRQRGGLVVCFDLPKGKSQLYV